MNALNVSRPPQGRKTAGITSMKSIRASIDRFLRSPPTNKPFSIISDAVFTEANKVLDAFVKDLRKTGKIAGVVHKKAVSKDQIQRLFESGELGPADSQNPVQLRHGFISPFSSDDEEEKISGS